MSPDPAPYLRHEGLSLPRSQTRGHLPLCIGTIASNTMNDRSHLAPFAMQDEQPDARDPGGLTPLHRAAAAGDVAACERWIDAGADINAGTGGLLVDGEPADEGTRVPGDTPLILAAQHGHPEVVALLLERGADASACNAERWGPLHAAVVGGHEAALEMLIAAGADLELSCIARVADEQLGWFFVGTPLHLAASWNRAQMAERLLRAGASDSAAWSDRRTPLIYAAARGNTAVVEVLCQHGADPTLREHRHENGYFIDLTPLHYAARNGHSETVAALLRHGAEPRARDSHSGKTADEIAREAE
jgi:ankyrin repeat protein